MTKRQILHSRKRYSIKIETEGDWERYIQSREQELFTQTKIPSHLGADVN